MTDETKTDAKKAKVATDDAGEPVRAFITYDEAEAQAKALGGAHVEPVGVAFAVVDDE